MIRDPGTAHLVHFFFEAGAILLGVQLYRRGLRRSGKGEILQSGNFAVALGCVAGAAIANKLAFWIENPALSPALAANPFAFFAGGQSIVGGLLGGLIGVEAAKRITGVTRSTGDAFVTPLLCAIMFGRIGCFLAGLHDDTYGVATDLPWGVDFGDGVRRHPTQLYEIAFAAALLGTLSAAAPALRREPGLTFKLFLTAYLTWRLAVDSIKPAPYAYPGGLSGIQVICLAALAVYLPFVMRSTWRLRHVPQESPVPLL
jgi:prolipoprotein diacylglyceryltransferase